jgi:hypothetical protein
METKLDDILPPMFLFSQFCELVQVVITHEKYLAKNIQLKKPKKKKRKKKFRQVEKICHQKKNHC